MDKLLIKRQLITHVRNAATFYPIVSVAGPRQAGKSTMLKQAFPDYQYVSMEDPDIYALATSDARGFFDSYTDGVIIDEALGDLYFLVRKTISCIETLPNHWQDG